MVGYEVKNDIVGTPQGSIISPILANIYLDKLDKFVEGLKAEFDSKVMNPQKFNRNPLYRSIESKIVVAKRKEIRDKLLLRNLSRQLTNTPTIFKSEVDNKIMYVRYADD